MNEPWREALAPELRRGLGSGSWQRIEQARDGRWLALPDGEDCVAWHALDLDSGAPRPLHPFADTTLRGLPHAVSTALHEGASLRLLAHKVARRAVLRVTHGDQSRLVKVYRKDRHLEQRWRSVHRIPGIPWKTPRVLRFDAERRILEAEWCSGRSLNQRWKAGVHEAADGERIAEALTLLRRQTIPDDFPVWRPEDEAALLLDRLQDFLQVLEHPPRAARSLVDRVAEALHRAPHDTVYCHRDFHDKQLLIDATGEHTLIDLDLVTRGPVGLDAGNIVAHVRLRARQGLALDWRRVVAPAVRDVVADGAADALPVWTAATLTRLALLYCRRRHAAGLTETLLEDAARALERRGEWKGVLA